MTLTPKLEQETGATIIPTACLTKPESTTAPCPAPKSPASTTGRRDQSSIGISTKVVVILPTIPAVSPRETATSAKVLPALNPGILPALRGPPASTARV